MTFIPQYDFDLLVANGRIPGLSSHDKFGRNLTIAATTEEGIWTPGGLITWQTSAAAVDVTAGANDVMTTGTGAWKVVIKGLDSSYASVQEEVELNGASIVTTTQTFLRVERGYVTECGSGGVNSGNIDVHWTGGSVDALQILAGAGQSEHLAFTVPAGKDAHLLSFMGGMTDDASSGTRSFELFIYYRLYNASSTNNYESWRRIHTVFLNQEGTTDFQQISRTESPIPAKSDIRVAGFSSKADTNAFGRIEYFLEDH
jgi:hypothetical protein